MHEDKLIKSEGRNAIDVGEVKTYLTGEDVNYTYRVWNAINPPSRMDFYAVGSPEEAVFVITDLAFEQIEHDGVKHNAFGLEVLKDGEWSEWTDDEDQFGATDILDLIEIMARDAEEDLAEYEALLEEEDG